MTHPLLLSHYIAQLNTIQAGYDDALSGVLRYRAIPRSDNPPLQININLFPRADDRVSHDDVQTAHTNLQGKKEDASTLRDDVHHASHLSSVEKLLLLQAIDHVINSYDMLIAAVPIEAQKGGYTGSTYQNITDCLHIIYHKETTRYGKSISDTPEEKDAVVTLLHRLFIHTHHRLSPPYDDIFRTFLVEQTDLSSDQLEAHLNKHNSTISQLPATWTHQTSGKALYGEDQLRYVFSRMYSLYGKQTYHVSLESSLTDASISRHNDHIIYRIPVCRTSEQTNDFYRQHNLLDSSIICFDDTVSNGSAGYEHRTNVYNLTFPKNKKYTRQKVCQRIDHEISTHFVRKENGVRGSGLSSATYLQTEEGLAMLNEFLVTIRTLDDVTAGDPTLHHISTYIGEQYDATQTQSLLTAYYLMLGDDLDTARQNATARTIRVKRYYSYDRPGASRKDTTYWRGTRTIVSYIKKLAHQHAHGKLSDADVATIIDQLYRGKYSLDDQPHMLTLHTQPDGSLPQFLHPLYTGKILYQLSQGVSRQEIYDADPRLQRAPPLAPEQKNYHDQIIDEILAFHAEVEKHSMSNQ